MKKTILTAFASIIALGAAAQTEIMKIELNDGTTQTIEVEKIKEITFSTDGENPADAYIGQFTGKNTVVVGGNFTYAADNVTFDITEGADNTLTVNIPEYVLTNTVMGDLTLGAHTIAGLAYDETTGAYVRDYGNDDLSMHFKAEQGGNVTMNKDYNFNPGSEITVEKTAAGIKITNKFKMGAMPFELVATFEGTK